MNWCGFPVGFRFAVNELSDEFKKRCWETVIKASSYADLTDMFLHEALLEDAASQMKVYIAIIGSPKVGPMQKNAAKWRRDTALLGHLTYFRPIVQENFIELYAPSHAVGTFLPDGSIKPEEGVCFLPKKVDKSAFISKKRKGIFLTRASEIENTDPSYSSCMEKIAEHAPTFEIKRLVFSDGPYALYHAASFRKALLYKCSYVTETDEKKEASYALLPGGKCLADLRQLSQPEDVKSFLKTLSDWHGNGLEALCNIEQTALLPEGCEAVTDIMNFYRFESALTDIDAAFCPKKDVAFFKQWVSTTTLIEI